jgi:hypothetical protein
MAAVVAVDINEVDAAVDVVNKDEELTLLLWQRVQRK